MKQFLLIALLGFTLNFAMANERPTNPPSNGNGVTAAPAVPASEAAIVPHYTEPNFKLNFYPNPVIKSINVEIAFERSGSSDIEIHFRNLIGKEMIDVFKANSSSAANKFEIDLADLPAGIYLMEIITYNNGTASKITKRITKV